MFFKKRLPDRSRQAQSIFQNGLDGFVPELPGADMAKLIDLRRKLYSDMNEKIMREVSTWAVATGIPIEYLASAAALAACEVAMTQAEALTGDNVVASTMLKSNLKDKFNNW